MAKKYLSLERLTEYDSLIKTKIDEDIDTLANQVAYIDVEDNEDVNDEMKDNCVKTVNGIAPDENGNVTVSANSSNSALVRLYLDADGNVTSANVNGTFYIIDLEEDYIPEQELHDAISNLLYETKYNVRFLIEDNDGFNHISTLCSEAAFGGNKVGGFRIFYNGTQTVDIGHYYIPM